MRKKLLVICSCFALLFVGVSVMFFVGAGTERAQESHFEAALPDNWYAREEAAESKIVETTDSGQDVLSYKGTTTDSTEAAVDVYEGEDRSQYRYNEDGELISYRAGLTESLPEPEKNQSAGMAQPSATILTSQDGVIIPARLEITDPQHLQLVSRLWQYNCELYGERMNEMELAWFRVIQNGDNLDYTVVFGKTYGQDGIILGKNVINTVHNEEIRTSSISGDLLEDFDGALLEAMSEEKLLSIIESQFRELKPQYASEQFKIELSVESIRLRRKDGEFLVQIPFSIIDATTGHLQTKDVWYYTIQE